VAKQPPPKKSPAKKPVPVAAKPPAVTVKPSAVKPVAPKPLANKPLPKPPGMTAKPPAPKPGPAVKPPTAKVAAKPGAAVSKTIPSAPPAAPPPAAKSGKKSSGKPAIFQQTVKSNGAKAGKGPLSKPVGSRSDFVVGSSETPRVQLPAVVPEAVPTDGKPRKNQAGLTSKELEFFRTLLLEKRRELVGDMSSMERDALRSSSGSNLSNLPLHMADMGTDNYEQEFTIGLMEKDRKLLKEINNALAKVQNGTYGLCEGTGLPIGKVRLEVQPWARFSIEFARRMEGGPVRAPRPSEA
jgi:DnaK suppressor protein